MKVTGTVNNYIIILVQYIRGRSAWAAGVQSWARMGVPASPRPRCRGRAAPRSGPPGGTPHGTLHTNRDVCVTRRCLQEYRR